jgi:hypothetical protein
MKYGKACYFISNDLAKHVAIGFLRENTIIVRQIFQKHPNNNVT